MFYKFKDLEIVKKVPPKALPGNQWKKTKPNMSQSFLIQMEMVILLNMHINFLICRRARGAVIYV